METYVVEPYGCCHGVEAAISLAKKVRLIHPLDKVYILGMLVHNEQVVQSLNELNIITLHNREMSLEQLLCTISDGIVIFTAHGHAPRLEEIARARHLTIYDATCPYVRTNHELIKKAQQDKRDVIFIGKANHPETVACLAYGTHIYLYDIDQKMAWHKPQTLDPIVITQTTLSILELQKIYDEIKVLYPQATISHEVCNSTRIRQLGLLGAPRDSDVVFVIGSPLSSNTNKLHEIANQTFKKAQVLQIATLDEVKGLNLSSYKKAVVAAGASTPRQTVLEIVEYLKLL